MKMEEVRYSVISGAEPLRALKKRRIASPLIGEKILGACQDPHQRTAGEKWPSSSTQLAVSIRENDTPGTGVLATAGWVGGEGLSERNSTMNSTLH